jgi:integrase/recombinase XerD
VICIQFPYYQNLINALRQRFPSAKWIQRRKSWYLPDLNLVRIALESAKPDSHLKLLTKIHPQNKKAFQDFYDQLQLKAYSPNTVRMYLSEFGHLFLLLNAYPVDNLSHKRLKDYFLY